MKWTHDPTPIIEFFVKAGLITALAAALLAPMTINAHGKDCAEDASLLKRAASEALPLPPIPNLETMPWLVRAPAHKTFKIDTLLAPKFEMMGPEVATAGDTGRLWLPAGLRSRWPPPGKGDERWPCKSCKTKRRRPSCRCGSQRPNTRVPAPSLAIPTSTPSTSGQSSHPGRRTAMPWSRRHGCGRCLACTTGCRLPTSLQLCAPSMMNRHPGAAQRCASFVLHEPNAFVRTTATLDRRLAVRPSRRVLRRIAPTSSAIGGF